MLAKRLKRLICDGLTRLLLAERRIDRYIRGPIDRFARPPLVALLQALINARRPRETLAIGEERPLPNEAAVTAGIIDHMARFMRQTYRPGEALRVGNTKTYGVARGEFAVLPDLPAHLRVGIFREARTYRAWVRFAGPGPLAPPDIEDNGILSLGIKLMGVDGPKLIDDERATQDFTGLSAPTFTMPNIVENLKAQRQLLEGTPLWYFINPVDSHLLDGLMQALYAGVHGNPLEVVYWSNVPYRFGEGRAIKYLIRPLSKEKTPIPRHPSDNYLREAMQATLRARAVTFEFLIQFQTDPWRMPIEHAGVIWPERLSPYLPVARLTVPAQRFDSPAQLAFAANLSYNPWHSLPEHRPLGNLNRTRRALYLEVSKLRQTMNGDRRLEPTGDEVFDDRPAPLPTTR